MLQLQASANKPINCIKQAAFITCNCCLADASFCLVTSSCSIKDSTSLFWSLQDLTAASLACLSTSIYKVFKHNWSITCYEFLTSREAACFIILIDSVCLSVCSKALTSEVHICASGASPGSTREYGSSSYMNVIGSRSRSQEKKGWQPSSILTMETRVSAQIQIPAVWKIPSPITAVRCVGSRGF